MTTRYVVEVRRYTEEGSAIVFLQEVETLDVVDIFAAVNKRAVVDPTDAPRPPRLTLRPIRKKP